MLAPPLSLIVTTRDREDVILRCLERCERQTLSDYELILIDDGSSDDTDGRVRSYAASAGREIVYRRMPPGGAARARNAAIELATGRILVLIGSDVLIEPHFLQTHLEFHLAHPGEHEVAIGQTRWSDSQPLTPFARWLEEEGIQFEYGLMQDGDVLDYHHFYTSNLSIKSTLAKRHRFDERFPGAGLEDVELGYRLTGAAGITITYLARALAFHDHPTNFHQSCARSYANGELARTLLARWPELAPEFGSNRDALSPPRRIAQALVLQWPLSVLVRTLCQAAGRLFVPDRVFRGVLMAYYQAGLAAAQRTASPR